MSVSTYNPKKYTDAEVDACEQLASTNRRLAKLMDRIEIRRLTGNPPANMHDKVCDELRRLQDIGKA
jgi:hypothetical protein